MIRNLFLFALSLLVCVFPAHAAVHAWTGASSASFSDPANWIGGSPDGDGDAELSFPASAARLDATNDLPSLMVRTITFSGSGYTVGGNAIALAAGAEILDSTNGPNELACNLVLADGATVYAGAFDVFGGSDTALILSGAIRGNGPLVKLGAGTLRFAGSAPNAYAGVTRVRNGVLQLQKSSGVAAIPSDLEVGGTDVDYARGRVVTMSDEQIPDTATIRLSTELMVAARETLGPIVIDGDAKIATGFGSASAGTIILAGDVTVEETLSSNSAHFDGDLRLAGMRTITTCDSCEAVVLNGVTDQTAGAGLTIKGGASHLLSVEIRGSYSGPTIVDDADVSVDNPSTTVRMRGGRIRGRFRSLVSEWGTVDLGPYGSLVTTGDVWLSPSTTVDVTFPGPKMNTGGVLDLHSATLSIADELTGPGVTELIIANDGAGSVLGTFRGIGEGEAYEGRLAVSYHAGDGNDISVTRTGRYPTEIHTSYPSRVGVGQPATIEAVVTFNVSTPVTRGAVILRDGATVLATATPDAEGHVAFTVYPEWPGHTYLLEYRDDVLLASSAQVRATVAAPTPQITSVDPASAIGGTNVAGTFHGSNFYEGGYVLDGDKKVPTTFVSANEVRFVWEAPRFDNDVVRTLQYVQPDGVRSNAVPVLLEAKPLPPGIISVEERALTARVVPGGGAAWMGVFYNAAGRLVRLAAVTPDSDGDGIVRWDVNFDVPPYAFWIAVDMTDGTISGTISNRQAPPLLPLPHKMFFRDPSGQYSHISTTVGWEELLWVRPGVGAWLLIDATDGASADLDGVFNGRVFFDVSQMRGGVENMKLPPPASVEPGDVFTGLYSPTRWDGGRVDDSRLHESDGAGLLSFVKRTGASSVDVDENAGVARVKVMRFDGTDGTVSINYATSDSTAQTGVQYVSVAGRLTFGPGEMLKTIEIPIVDDHHYYGRTSFEVTLSNPAGTTITGEPKLTVRITENDAAPQIRIQDLTVAEGDQTVSEAAMSVSLDAPQIIPIVVHWFHKEEPFGNSEYGGDLVFVPGGPLMHTIMVPYRANRVAEDDREIGVSAVMETEETEKPNGHGRLRIVDDDLDEVMILDATVTESQDAVEVRISTTRPSRRPITVNFATASGTATAGSDFTATSGSATLSGAYGEYIVRVPIIHDADAEAPETFTVTLSDVRNARVIRGIATVVITDPDPSDVPTLSASTSAGAEASPDVIVRISLSRPATQLVQFRVSTQSGTATAGKDFVAIDQIVRMSPGMTSATLSIDAIYDLDENEGNETFTITLSEASGAVIATPAVTATIFDRAVHPGARAISGADVSVTEGDSGTTNAHFVVRLASAATSTTTVPYATADAGAVASSDYVATSGTLTFASGEREKTVDVAIIGDRVYEDDEEFMLVIGGTPIACRIVNDDAEPKRRRAAS